MLSRWKGRGLKSVQPGGLSSREEAKMASWGQLIIFSLGENIVHIHNGRSHSEIWYLRVVLRHSNVSEHVNVCHVRSRIFTRNNDRILDGSWTVSTIPEL